MGEFIPFLFLKAEMDSENQISREFIPEILLSEMGTDNLLGHVTFSIIILHQNP